MTITVKYFASLREMLGRSQEQLDIDNQTITVAALWQQVSGQRQGLPEKVLAAVNMEYVQADALVHPGDEVAFFPPVTGG